MYVCSLRRRQCHIQTLAYPAMVVSRLLRRHINIEGDYKLHKQTRLLTLTYEKHSRNQFQTVYDLNSSPVSLNITQVSLLNMASALELCAFISVSSLFFVIYTVEPLVSDHPNVEPRRSLTGNLRSGVPSFFSRWKGAPHRT